MLLSQHPAISEMFLFSGMSESEIIGYLNECEHLHYSSGDIIHSSKSPLHGIGIVLSGRARIISGNNDTLLRILKQDDFFGVASLFSIDEHNRTSVIASCKCSILVIPENVVMRIISSDKNAAMRYIKFLSDRINFLNSRIGSLSAGDSVAKVAGYILSLNFNSDGVALLEEALTNVASRLNIGRASLYRTIDRFVADGFIKRDKNSMEILNRDGLEDIFFKKDPGNSRQRKAKL